MPSDTTAPPCHNELFLSFMTRYPTPLHPEPSHVNFARRVIIHQVEGSNSGHYGCMSELYFETAARRACHGIPRFIPVVLRRLLWRAKYQSCVFQTFMQLCRHGHCALTSLERPVSYSRQPTPLVRWIHATLRLLKPGLYPGQEDRSTTWQTFELPLRWLAIMIARSATNLQNVLDFIGKTEYLETKDPIGADALIEFPSSATFPDPTASVSLGTNYVGIMLPSNVNLGDDANSNFQAIHDRFMEVWIEWSKRTRFFFRYLWRRDSHWRISNSMSIANSQS